jgi:AcrR family transcriptional regulator
MSTKPPRKHPDAANAEARRAQVLDAAAECFRRHGFHGASMANISKSAGMSAGHIYNYFESKEEIIFGIVDRHTEDVLELMRDVMNADGDVLDVILGNAADSIASNTDLPHVSLMVEVSAESARNPAVAAKLHAADGVLSERLNELLMSSEKAQAYRDDPLREGRLNMLIALFEGLRHRVLHNPRLNRTALLQPLRKAILAVVAGS